MRKPSKEPAKRNSKVSLFLLDSCSVYSSIPKMEAICSSEMSDFLQPASTDFLLSFSFDPKDGGGMFLRNFRLFPAFLIWILAPSTLKMVAIYSCETLEFLRNTSRYNLEGRILHSYRLENLKFNN
jgi:hypothetical protein